MKIIIVSILTFIVAGCQRAGKMSVNDSDYLENLDGIVETERK